MSFPMIESQVFGEGLPVVLLHAFPLSHLIWENLQSPPGFQLILPDFPGFGASPLAPAGLNLPELALGLEKHLEEKGVKGPVVLGGISMGGYWSLEFARQFPDRIKGLMLFSTKAGADQPEARQKRLEMALKVEKEGTGPLAEAMLPGLLGKSTLERKKLVAKKVSQWIRETKPEAVALAQRAMADRRDQTDLLPRLKMKTLVLAGAEDALIPVSESESMAQLLPDAKLKILQGVGHLLPIESPESFQKSLDDFLLPLAW